MRDVVAFTVEYARLTTRNDLAVASVQPMTAGWNGVEHPEQLILRPDGMFVDRRGMVGDRRAAIARFRDYRRRQRRDPRRDAQRLAIGTPATAPTRCSTAAEVLIHMVPPQCCGRRGARSDNGN